MRAKIIALPVAAGLALGGASLATADDPPSKDEKPSLVQPAPAPAVEVPRGGAPVEVPPPGALRPALPFLAHEGPFGLDREIAEDMAKELGLPADRVADAMRKAIGAQFDRRRDEALECFDDRKKCEAAAALPPFIPRARLVPPGRTTRP